MGVCNKREAREREGMMELELLKIGRKAKTATDEEIPNHHHHQQQQRGGQWKIMSANSSARRRRWHS